MRGTQRASFWALLLVLLLCGWRSFAQTEQQPLVTGSEPQPNSQPDSSLKLLLDSLLQDSMQLHSRLQQRTLQAGDLLLSLGIASDVLSSLQLSFSEAVTLLVSLQTDLTGISNYLVDSRTDLQKLSGSIDQYTSLMQSQITDLKSERDAEARRSKLLQTIVIIEGVITVAAVVTAVVVSIKP